jgi:hypothetical protein
MDTRPSFAVKLTDGDAVTKESVKESEDAEAPDWPGPHPRTGMGVIAALTRSGLHKRQTENTFQ